MDEENKSEEVTKEDSNTGDEPQATSLITDAHSAAERLEKANLKQEELLRRQEEIMATQRLGGRADAGQVEKKETEDEKWKREAKVRYAGTGMDPTDDE